MALADGSVLVCEDGSEILVKAAPEPLYAVTGRDALHLSELAWHLGNRHLAAQIEAGRILILRDHVIKAMVEGLGGTVADVVEPFSPVRGAYHHAHAHDGPDRRRHDDDHGHGHADDEAMAMDERAARSLVRLMTLLSPAFPVGAFSYSHGIERAVHDGMIGDRARLVDWIADLLTFGSGWNDAVLLAAAWRADERRLPEVAELAEALAGSAERHLEAMAQGRAFAVAARAWPEAVPAALAEGGAYPVVVGAVARRLGLALDAALPAYLNAFVSNLVQAAVRLVPLGQSDGGGGGRGAGAGRAVGRRSAPAVPRSTTSGPPASSPISFR